METTRVIKYTVQVENSPELWLTQGTYDDPTIAMSVAEKQANAYGYRTRVVRTYTEVVEMCIYSGS